MISTPLRIGTRGSPLALAQAHEVQRRLHAALNLPAEMLPLVVIKTSGDLSQATGRALSESGGKGMFTKEIDEAQLSGAVDIAVHSGKDLPTALPDGLELAGLLEREDPRDAFLSHSAPTLEALPAGALVGTASLRRQALVKALRPDLRVEVIRGNVDSRIAKLDAGQCDAIILAAAGLNRLGLSARITSLLDPLTFTPAVAQGAIGLTARAGDTAGAAAIQAIAHPATTRRVTAERAYLAVLEGSCRTPIGGHAVLAGETLGFRGIVLEPDGSRHQRIEGVQASGEGDAAFGHRMGEAMRAALQGATRQHATG
jgi:hydroxymethylbilane synthase